MCPEMEVRLNEYVDGTLAVHDRAAVEQHLAGCAGCRAALVELQGLVAGARDLPRSIVPKRDLWAGVAARINERRAVGQWWRKRTFWGGGALATAAMLVLGLVIYRLTVSPPVRPGGGGSEGKWSWATVQADYDRAADELSGVLATQQDRLPPGTVALVERNLALIDAAIRESRDALAREPGNADLQGLYAAAARQKVELLRWAARVAGAG